MREVSSSGTGAVRMKSSYEVRVARVLDALGIRWEYEQHRFAIGKNRTWAPDFYLPDADVFWEVKGYYGPNSRDVVARFREHHPHVAMLLIFRSAIEALETAVKAATMEEWNGSTSLNFWGLRVVRRGLSEPALIDSNAAKPTRRKADYRHRDRLSEPGSGQPDHATVGTYGN